MPDIPQLAFPPRVVNGELATVEQGTGADIIGQVHLLCLTPHGWFTQTDSDRDMGLYDQAHLAGGADMTEIARQIDTYVPDAQEALDGQLDQLNPALSVVNARIGQGT